MKNIKLTVPMDSRTMLSKYPKLQNFLLQNPEMDTDALIDLIEPLRCAVKLNGQVLSDLEQNDTFTNIFFFASSLGITHYKSLKQRKLIPVIIDRFNEKFSASAPLTEPYTAVEQNVIVPTLTPYDHTVIQLPLSIGPPQEFAVMEPIDLDQYTSTYLIDTIQVKDQMVPSKYSILEFMKFTMHELYRTKYRNMKLYKGRYYEYFEQENWTLIGTIDQPVKELCDIIERNVNTKEHRDMFNYMNNTDALRIQIQKELSRYMQKIIKAFSMYTCPSVVVLEEEEQEPEHKKQKQETA